MLSNESTLTRSHLLENQFLPGKQKKVPTLDNEVREPPLRIACVVQSQVAGGAENYLRLLYDRTSLPADTAVRLFGHIPHWDDAGQRATAIDLGPKWGRRTLAKGLLRVREERMAVEKSVADYRADVFHLQFKREQIAFTKSLARTAPVVWTEHGVGTPEMRAVLGVAYRRAAQHAAAIVCVSDDVAAHVRALVGESTQIVTIENAIDTSQHRPTDDATRRAARSELGLKEDALVAAWVGRVDPDKRPMLALDIAQGWHGHLLVAGTGSEASAVRSRAETMNNVHFLGYRDPDVVYRAADVFLMTTRGLSEGLPNNTLLEAAARGIPTVGAPVGAVADVVRRAGGKSPDTDAPEEWRHAIEALRADVGARGRAIDWALDHDIVQWRDRHFAAFRRVVSAAG
ncbi:glycosyltransferase family 4 protein [Demequina sp. SO4-13]|uniref:glycosyltransferase family 4 protein n=1 Tax=Demequina sp. SO4-13 TaxID=3401027 RepID=UPI003AF9A47C